jgi:hypothetical protein
MAGRYLNSGHLKFFLPLFKKACAKKKCGLGLVHFRSKQSHSKFGSKNARRLGGKYSYSDLAKFRGCVYAPYQVSAMSIFEQYRMNMPLFFPTVDLLIKWHKQYHILFEKKLAGCQIPKEDDRLTTASSRIPEIDS